MSERHGGWKKRYWKSKTKPHVSAVEDTAQSSQDRWMQSKYESKWREDSGEVHEWASSLKETSHGWNKSFKDSGKREGDILMLAEMAANDEKQEDEEWHNINKLFRKLHKERKEEDEARALLGEMQRKIWRRPRPEPLRRNRRYSAGTTSTCGRGPRTVGYHISSWT